MTFPWHRHIVHTNMNYMKTIALFPGLGATAKLFVEQRTALGESLILPDWILPESGESLRQYAERFAETIEETVLRWGPSPSPKPELVLGGFSFGGMISLELAQCLNQRGQIRVPKVLLISSGRTRNIIKTSFVLQSQFARSLPARMLESLIQSPVLNQFLKLEELTDAHRQLLKEMAFELDVSFFQWSLGACASWNPKDRFLSETLSFEIHEIQGEADPLIPFSTERNVTTIPKARHLIQYSHSKEVNQWILHHIQNG